MSKGQIANKVADVTQYVIEDAYRENTLPIPYGRNPMPLKKLS